MIKTVVDRLEEGFIALLLAAMTMLTFVNVVLRYGFNSGMTWSMEITEFLFAWLVLFGMSYGVKVGSHIGVDALVQLFAKPAQRITGIFVALVCMSYAALILYGGWESMTFYHMIGIEAEDSPIPMWVVYLILPLGGALLLFRLGQVLWRILLGQQNGFSLADEAREAIETIGEGDKADVMADGIVRRDNDK